MGTVLYTTVSIPLAEITGTADSQDAFVRFELMNYEDESPPSPPKVLGGFEIVPTFQDFYPDVNGVVTAVVVPNYEISPANTYYAIKFYRGGVLYYICNVVIPGSNTTIDFTTLSCNNINQTAPPGCGGVVQVFGAIGTNSMGGSSANATLSVAVTAGNSIVVLAVFTGNVSGIGNFTVSDNAGNVYTLVASTLINNTSQAEIWKATAATSRSITVTVSGSTICTPPCVGFQDFNIMLLEVSKLGLLDFVVADNHIIGPPYNTGVVGTATGANEVLVGFGKVSDGNSTLGTDFHITSTGYITGFSSNAPCSPAELGNCFNSFIGVYATINKSGPYSLSYFYNGTSGPLGLTVVSYLAGLKLVCP